MAAGADLLQRPALELAALVRAGDLAARDLAEASLRRIEALDPALNAFVDVFADEALETAAAIAPGDPRPFAGVPIAVKNSRSIAGRRLTLGSAFMGDWAPEHDHNVVARLRAAGFVVVGTTTLPEWGIQPWTNTRRCGATRNPWDRTRTSGGSSGGAATAVAAGMVPIAHATDGGGSARIPAACCGLLGLKPQRHRISLRPEAGESFLAVDGVLSRTVADTAAALDVLAGREVGDGSWAPPPPEPFAASAARAPGRLRIALTTTPALADAPVDPACTQAAREAGALLDGLGHAVEEVEPPWQAPWLLDAFTALFAPLVMLQVDHARRVAGREPAAPDMEPVSWMLWELVGRTSSLEASVASARLQAWARAVLERVDPYDAVLTPSLAHPPPPLADVHWDTDDPAGLFRRAALFTPFSAVANVTGQPAVSVPLAEHDGLPVGVQMLGRQAGEGALLALAAQLEATRPWASRRPPER
jgi:amidase